MVNKVNGIDTTNFAKITKYEKDGPYFENKISKIDKKVPDVSSLVKKKKILILKLLKWKVKYLVLLV